MAIMTTKSHSQTKNYSLQLSDSKNLYRFLRSQYKKQRQEENSWPIRRPTQVDGPGNEEHSDNSNEGKGGNNRYHVGVRVEPSERLVVVVLTMWEGGGGRSGDMQEEGEGGGGRRPSSTLVRWRRCQAGSEWNINWCRKEVVTSVQRSSSSML